MLARSFLTPEKLNISDKQFDALVQVLGMLERGELPWYNKDKVFPSDVGFNMAKWPSPLENKCGSVGCFGYWCEKLGGAPRWEFELNKTTEIGKLFYPVGFGRNFNSVSVDEGMQALSNYLTTGKADWAGVLT